MLVKTVVYWILLGAATCYLHPSCRLFEHLKKMICRSPNHFSNLIENRDSLQTSSLQDDLPTEYLTSLKTLAYRNITKLVPHGTVCAGPDAESQRWIMVRCWQGIWKDADPTTTRQSLKNKRKRSEYLGAEGASSGQTEHVKTLHYRCENRCDTGWWHYCQNMCWINRRRDVPPTINCPSINDFTVEFGKQDVRVTWRKPSAHDEEDGNVIPRKTAGPEIGSYQKDGNYLVAYEAKDSKGNTAYCSVSFNVYASHCPNPDSNSLYFLHHGTVNCTKSNLVGSVCFFYCDANYELKGHKSSSCLQDETWSSPNKPDCVALRCSAPPLLENIIIKACPEPFEIGAICHVECLAGYQLVGDHMTCKLDRRWSTVECIDVTRPAIKCPNSMNQKIQDKTSKVSVRFKLESIVDDSSTQVTTNYLSGQAFGLGRYVVIFTATDKFGNEAKCAFNLTVDVHTCPVLNPRFASVSCNDSHYIWSYCSVKCIFGSNDNSDHVVNMQCQMDGTWTDKLPNCNDRSCGSPPQNLSVHCSDGHSYGSVCAMVCPQGSDIVKFSTITCQSNQRWSVVGACIDTQSPRFLVCPRSVVQYNSLHLLNFPNFAAWDSAGKVYIKALNYKLYTGILTNVTLEASDKRDYGNKALCKFQIIKPPDMCDYPFYVDTSEEKSMTFECGFLDNNTHYCDINCMNGYQLQGSATMTCVDNVWTYDSQPKCERRDQLLCWVPRRLYRGNITEYRVNNEIRWKLDCVPGFEVPHYKFRDKKDKYFYCKDGMIQPMRIALTSCKPAFVAPGVVFNFVFIIYGLKCLRSVSEIKKLIVSMDLYSKVDGRFVDNNFIIFRHHCDRNTRDHRRFNQTMASYTYIEEAFVAVYVPTIKATEDAWLKAHNDLGEQLKKNIKNAEVQRTTEKVAFKFDYGGLTYVCQQGEKYSVSYKKCATCGRGSIYTGEYCEPCPKGTYQKYDSGYRCAHCPSGWRSPHMGLISVEECSSLELEGEKRKANCERGLVKVEGTSQCIPCPMGTFQFDSQCSSCPEGTWTLFSGSSSPNHCISFCAPGKFSRSGLEPCLVCPKGQYAQSRGQKQCSKCPFGTWTSEEGAFQKEMCKIYDVNVNSTFRVHVNETGLKRDAMTLSFWVNLLRDVEEVGTAFFAGPLMDSIGSIGCGLFTISFRLNGNGQRKKRRTWRHLALVYSLNKMVLYVDGKEHDMLPADFPRDCSILEYKGNYLIPNLMMSEILMTNAALMVEDVARLSSKCGESASYENILYWDKMKHAVIAETSCDDTDNCISEPCGDHGVCIDLYNDYVCYCTDYFQWDHCKSPPDWCLGNQCKNAKQCINDLQANTYRCDCKEGHSGKLCESSRVGDWTEWSEWYPCHQTCGETLTIRQRECVTQDKSVSASCSGESIESKLCESTPCPIDGGMSEWQAWTCISDDKGGMAVRVRKCNNPAPQYGGDTCWQPTNEYKACDSPSFRPVDGGLGPWSDWSYCNLEDNARTRVRLCENPPPNHGGRNCSEEEALETMPCELVEKKGCWKLVKVGINMKRLSCTYDQVASVTECFIECKKGYTVDTDLMYTCGAKSNYTWSHITRTNPRGLLPHCTKTYSVSERSLTMYGFYLNLVGHERALTVLLQDNVEGFVQTFCLDCQWKVSVSVINGISNAIITISLPSPIVDPYTDDEDQTMKYINALYKFEFVAQHFYNSSDSWSSIFLNGREYRVFTKNMSIHENCPEGTQALHGLCVYRILRYITTLRTLPTSQKPLIERC
uniref:Sushi, von Willebrand factor type A, EGF and pentraxin domain-containing protein 1 n=1 Tax=Biomphalaria glabrata TaxID=6526 RepID=A0A2C9M0L7_BIOGL